ncbi:MAG: hypothetical protein ABFD49_10315 [Armatimonadota bacterium]|nr:hypothetical protein [bacterium]
MIIENNTKFCISTALSEAVMGYPTDGLLVEIKYSPAGSGRYISGTYYRMTPTRRHGKLIRLRINRSNRYPVQVQFKTSDYKRKIDSRGQTIIYQKMRVEKFNTPEDLLLAIFLHEFSHYLDHIEGRNGRYKQTKADKFAIDILQRLDVIAKR